MNARVLFAASLVLILAASGCSNGGENPATPPLSEQSKSAGFHSPSQTHLWGFYDVYVDLPSQTATPVVNRNAMFIANVVNSLNGKPSSLAFHIHDRPADPGGTYIDGLRYCVAATTVPSASRASDSGVDSSRVAPDKRETRLLLFRSTRRARHNGILSIKKPLPFPTEGS